MARKTTEWVFTNPIDFKDAEVMRVHGNTFRTLPSPYIVPIALRVVFHEDRIGRSLELKYLGDEPLSKGSYAAEAEIEYGKRTLRPRTIFVPIQASGTITEFIAKIDDALDSFKRVHEESYPGGLTKFAAENRLVTVKLIKSAIRKYQSELSFCLESNL